MKRFSLLLLITLLAVTTSACGPNDPVTPSSTAPDAVGGPTESLEGLKHRLTSVSQTGDTGSALEGIDEGIEKFVTDPAKKTSLLKDLRELNSSTDNERNKKTAARMLQSL